MGIILNGKGFLNIHAQIAFYRLGTELDGKI